MTNQIRDCCMTSLRRRKSCDTRHSQPSQPASPGESETSACLWLTAMTSGVLVGRAAASLGYLELKPEQEEAVASFVRGADVFVSLPTGYGKSLFWLASSGV